jgi:sucrose-6-phosphate hydrolase SacC (GH32 family)
MPPAPAVSRCVVPVDAWLEPIFHLVPKQLNASHCADAASVIFLDGTWHWWLGCEGGWHHIVSKGPTALVDWTFADPLLVTGQGGDTGSVTVTKSGIYLFLPGCGGLCRRVALDRSMTRWSNPTLAKGTDRHPSNFRDPSRPFLHHDGKWYIVAGSGLTFGEHFGNMTGPLAFGMMYVADDDTLATWQFTSFIHVGNQTRDGVSIDTFECPDVWPLPESSNHAVVSGGDRVVFEASMCSDTCEAPHCAPKPGSKPYPPGSWNNHGEEYWIGSIDPMTKVLTNISHHAAVDYGEYYASKTAAGMDLLGRRVLFGYLEASVNRQTAGADRWSTSCGAKLVEPEALPREVTLHHDGSLGFEPVAELQALRVRPSEMNKTAISLNCGDKVAIGDMGHSFEVRASFTATEIGAGAAAAGVSFGLTVLASVSGEEVTAVGLTRDRAHFYVDKTRSTLRNATPPVFKDLMTAPLSTAGPSATISAAAVTTNITVFVDGRVVETFVEGRVISTLVYPSLNTSTQLGLFMRCANNSGGHESVTASVRAWSLRGVTVARNTAADVA